MIDWSDTKLKLTSGIGALWMTALLGELSHSTIPVWLVMVLTMFPLVAFLLGKPREMRRSIVLPLQVLASLWYLLLAACLMILTLARDETIPGWPIFFVGIIVGSIPCVVILWKALSLRNDEQGRETES